uniref:Uncharacterized protein n=1 Tax=Steinernema glaseri TaxID=37863 RepID=A0A1I7Y0C2_9BILA
MEHEVSESVTFTARSPEWKMECSNSSTTPPSESDVASPASVEACAAGSPSESIASVPSQGKTEAAETLLAMAEDTVEPQIDDSFNEEDWLAPRT